MTLKAAYVFIKKKKRLSVSANTHTLIRIRFLEKLDKYHQRPSEGLTHGKKKRTTVGRVYALPYNGTGFFIRFFFADDDDDDDGGGGGDGDVYIHSFVLDQRMK